MTLQSSNANAAAAAAKPRRNWNFLFALTLLGLLGVIIDPTTAGLGDSERAMTYEEPWRD